jgi:DnaJ-class molecular chaperone
MTKKIQCSYCSGAGKDPFELLSANSFCLVCEGTGQVEIKEPFIKCNFCKGTGKNPLGARVSCIVCGGKGNNYCESFVQCTKCKGTGKSVDSLPCTLCGGKGVK